MTIQEQRRKSFEEAFPLPEGLVWDEEHQRYTGIPMYWLWCDRFEVWCKALDRVCITLPDCDPGEAVTFGSVLEQCREAIHAAGVKTK